MNLTAHFTLEELDPHSAAPLALRGNLLRTAAWLEAARAVGGDVPLRVTSGYRPPDANAAAGGSATSDHMDAEAADFAPLGLSAKDWLARTEGKLPAFDQLIYYPLDGHIHVGLGARMRGQRLMALAEGKFGPIGSWNEAGNAPLFLLLLLIVALVVLGVFL